MTQDTAAVREFFAKLGVLVYDDRVLSVVRGLMHTSESLRTERDTLRSTVTAQEAEIHDAVLAIRAVEVEARATQAAQEAEIAKLREEAARYENAQCITCAKDLTEQEGER